MRCMFVWLQFNDSYKLWWTFDVIGHNNTHFVTNWGLSTFTDNALKMSKRKYKTIQNQYGYSQKIFDFGNNSRLTHSWPNYATEHNSRRCFAVWMVSVRSVGTMSTGFFDLPSFLLLILCTDCFWLSIDELTRVAQCKKQFTHSTRSGYCDFPFAVTLWKTSD